MCAPPEHLRRTGVLGAKASGRRPVLQLVRRKEFSLSWPHVPVEATGTSYGVLSTEAYTLCSNSAEDGEEGGEAHTLGGAYLI